jgi:hypothetical protein
MGGRRTAPEMTPSNSQEKWALKSAHDPSVSYSDGFVTTHQTDYQSANYLPHIPNPGCQPIA